MICPKCEYERRAEDRAPAGECPRCGVLYSKAHGRATAPIHSGPIHSGPIHSELPPLESPPLPSAPERGHLVRIGARLVAVPETLTPLAFWGHVAVYAVLFVWGWMFVLADFRSPDLGSSFMHNVDLVFHEAGHVLFRPFGDFMTVLGGSLNQLLVPAIVVCAFLWKRENFGAAVGLWWLGQSFVDLAPYIYDASRLVMPLLGGVTGADVPGYHDWNNILRRLDLLSSDWLVAKWSARIGATCIVAFMVWGATLLFREYRNLGANSYE